MKIKNLIEIILICTIKIRVKEKKSSENYQLNLPKIKKKRINKFK